MIWTWGIFSEMAQYTLSGMQMYLIHGCVPLVFWETTLKNASLKTPLKQYITYSCRTVLNSVFIFILCVYSYYSLPAAFLSEFWRLGKSNVNFSPNEVGRQTEWSYLLLTLSPQGNTYLSVFTSEFYIYCASPAWNCLLRIQLHHFYPAFDSRPFLQFIKWMELYFQRHCWGVRNIGVTLLEEIVYQISIQKHSSYFSLMFL